MLKNKPTEENCREIDNEPQNNVTLGKVGAGKATGRACRLKREQNGGLCDKQNGASNQNASVCLCVSVCEKEEGERRGGNKEEGAERTSRKTSVHT